jgi:Flp pilus assembly protein TadD
LTLDQSHPKLNSMRARKAFLGAALALFFWAPAAAAGDIEPLARARAFARRADYEQAEKVLARAVRENAGDRAANELLGFCLMRLFRFDEACAAFEAGDEAERYHFVNYGYCLRKAGRLPEAQRAFTAALERVPPGDTWATYCRIELQELAPIAEKRAVLALAQADDQVLAILNGKPCACARGGGEAGVALDDLLVPGKNDLRVLAVNTRGGWAYRVRLTVDGKEVFSAGAGRASAGGGAFDDDRSVGVVAEFAIEIAVADDRSFAVAATRTALDMGDALARLRAADGFWAKKRPEESIARLEAARARYPLLDIFPRRIAERREEQAENLPLSREAELPRAHLRAKAAEARERWVDVRRKVAALVPDDAGALAALAEAYVEAGQYDFAEKVYRRLVSLDPNRPEVYVGLSVALVKLGRAKEAVLFAGEAATRAPGCWEAHCARGDALLAAGDVRGALAAFARAVEADPVQAEWIEGKIAAAANRGGANAAGIEAAARAASAAPGDGAAQKALGDALFRGMRWEEARKAYAKAGEIAPGLPGLWPVAGLAAELAGDADGAEACYRRAPREDPLLDLARRRLARLKQLRAAATVTPPPAPVAPGPVPIDFAEGEGDDKANCLAAIDAIAKARPVLAAGLRALPPLRDGAIGPDEARAAERIRALALGAKTEDARRALALIERQVGPRAGRGFDMDGALDDWGPADRLAREPARAGGPSDLVELYATIRGRDLFLAWRAAAPAAPSRDCAYWAQIYPLEKGRPFLGVGIAGGDPVLVRIAPGGKREEWRGAASGVVWRAGEAVEAKVPLDRLGGERRLRVEAYTWSEKLRGRADSIAREGVRPNVDDGYAPALLALFEIAREVDLEPEDRVALAIALASSDFYALGDSRVHALVAEDDRRMLRLARSLGQWQRGQGLPQLSDQPLAALLFWADRAVQRRPDGPAEYRRDTVSPATLEAMFRYAKDRGFLARSAPELVERIERHLCDPLRWQYTSAEAAARGARRAHGEIASLTEDERRDLSKLVREAWVDGRKVSTDGGFTPDILFDYLVSAGALVGHFGSLAQATADFCRALGLPATIVQGIDERSAAFGSPRAFVAYWDGAAGGWRSNQARRYSGGRALTLFWFLPGAAAPTGARSTGAGGLWFPVKTTYGEAGRAFEMGAAIEWWEERLRRMANGE